MATHMYTLMIKVIVKTGLLVGSLAATLFILYGQFSRHDSVGYFASIIDKHRRIDTLTGTPRLLIAGGSGTAFGIDSQVLEDSLGIPVTNLGIHAGLGLPFMLKELKAVAKPGDVVLFIPEYYLGKGDDYTQFYISDTYEPARAFMTFDNSFDYIVRRTRYLLYRIRTSLFLASNNAYTASGSIKDTTSVYFRDAFSVRGDLLSPLNNKRSGYTERLLLDEHGYSQEVEAINEAANELKRRGVKLCISYPAFAASQFDDNMAAITHYVQKVEKVKNATLISSPAQVRYSDTCFFDTPYHLHTYGRQRYTRQLVADLKKVPIQ